MQITKKGVIIASIITIAALGTFFTIRYIIKKSGKGGQDKKGLEESSNGAEISTDEFIPTIKETTSSPLEKETSTDSVLKVGVKGQNVALLQTLLNYVLVNKLGVDGKYGENTRIMVKSYFGYYCVMGDCTVEPKDFTKLKQAAVIKAGSATALMNYLKSNSAYINAVKHYTPSAAIK